MVNGQMPRRRTAWPDHGQDNDPTSPSTHRAVDLHRLTWRRRPLGKRPHPAWRARRVTAVVSGVAFVGLATGMAVEASPHLPPSVDAGADLATPNDDERVDHRADLGGALSPLPSTAPLPIVHTPTPRAMAAEIHFPAMGSSAHVIVVGGHPSLPARARRSLDALERAWSRFLPDSEVSLLNASPGSRCAVSPETRLLVRRAIEGYRFTAGRFDPTVLPAVIAAGYDRDFGVDRVACIAPSPRRRRARTRGHRDRRGRGHGAAPVRHRVRPRWHRQGTRRRSRRGRAARARRDRRVREHRR